MIQQNLKVTLEEKVKVLILDDDTYLTKSVFRTLRNEPYEVIVSNDPIDAFRIVRTENISIVVSDYSMPSMNGQNFLLKIKEIKPEIIRIMITGNADLNLALSMINEGEIFRFFQKPINAIELAVSLREACTRLKLFEKASELLQSYREQKHMIESLEKNHPGISRITRDSTGHVVLENSTDNFEDLIKEIEKELL
ncbi:MAG: response regulator [Bdellovibrionales bacterium]|nr:response regulator [Bdellovibrionales bacterium]